MTWSKLNLVAAKRLIADQHDLDVVEPGLVAQPESLARTLYEGFMTFGFLQMIVVRLSSAPFPFGRLNPRAIRSIALALLREDLALHASLQADDAATCEASSIFVAAVWI